MRNMVLSRIELEAINIRTLPQFLSLIKQITRVIDMGKEELFLANLLDDKRPFEAAVNEINSKIGSVWDSLYKIDAGIWADFGLTGDVLRFKFLGLNHALTRYNNKPTKLRLIRVLRHIMPVLESLINVLQNHFPQIFAALDAVKEILTTFFNWLLDKERQLS